MSLLAFLSNTAVVTASEVSAETAAAATAQSAQTYGSLALFGIFLFAGLFLIQREMQRVIKERRTLEAME